MDFHVSDMKPFVFYSAVVDPMDVARRDYMEYFVDKILQHRGNIGAGAVQTSKRYYEWWLVYMLQTMVNNAWAELTMISKGVHDI